jgi:hypothetical protein
MNSKHYSKQLSQLRQKIIGFLLLPGLCLGLTGCGKSETIEPLHFYMVISPINKDQKNQLQEARAFFSLAQGQGQSNTKIIVPGHRYTVAMFCETNIPDFPTSGVDLRDKKDIPAITRGVNDAFVEISDSQKNCTASAESLVNLAPYLNDAASQRSEKIILLIQVPWSNSDLQKYSTKIKEGMDKLAASKKVEKIILFGVDEAQGTTNTAAKLFQSFNTQENREVVMPAATNPSMLAVQLKEIKSNILKIK